MKKLIKFLFIGVISVSFFSCVGKPIKEEVSTMYHRNWGSIYYTNRSGTLVMFGHKIKGADVKTFVPLAEKVAMDKNVVFYKTFPQPQVDRATFQVKEDGTMRDKNHIYVTSFSNGEENKLKILYNVDLETYGSYKGHSGWAYDKDHVYTGYSRPVDVDRTTFSFISNHFMKDKDYVYSLVFGELKKMKISTDSIISLSDRYIRDNKQIYFFDADQVNDFVSIPFESPNSIKIMQDPYLVVDNKLYNRGLLMNGADISSFEILKDNYSKDASHIFYNNMDIQSADVSGFQILQEGIAKDKQAVYLAGKKMNGVDPQTFRILNPIYVADKTHVYLVQSDSFMVIEEADPATFKCNERKGTSYGSDKMNEYYNGRRIIKD